MTLGRALGFSEDLLIEVDENYMESHQLTDAEKAVLYWAEVVTEKLYQDAPGRPSQRPMAMAKLKAHFDNEQIVELTLAIGHFNFWNRFTDSLEIDLEDEKTRGKFDKSTNINKKDYMEFMRSCWWNNGETKIGDKNVG